MKLSLSTRWFLWLSIAVAAFCVAQTFGMIWLEAAELMRGDGTLEEELTEIAVLLSVSVCVFVLMLGGFWFVSKRMVRPIRAIAESADRIGKGQLQERVEGGNATDEIGMLASTLNRAFGRYHEIVLRLDRFAGNASHQLRTPLTSIRSIGEVCLQKERTPVEYRECIEDMLGVARDLTAVVEKLLAVARLNPSRVRQNFGPVSLSEVLSQVLGLYRVMLEEKHIEMELREPQSLSVKGDAALIGQAIGNVFDNAARATPEGGTVAVTLREHDGNALLQICDTGAGIPDDIRLGLGSEGRNTSWNGELPTGRMGLTIVSEIMRVHDGTLDIRTRESGGTCVELTWPCI